MPSSLGSLLLAVSMWATLTLVCCSSGSIRSDSSVRPKLVGAQQLISEYKANEVRADETWKGKRLAVVGIVESVGKDILDTPYVTLSGDGEAGIPTVQCMFDDKAAGLSGIDKGQTITVVGTCKGKTFNVLLRDCSIR